MLIIRFSNILLTRHSLIYAANLKKRIILAETTRARDVIEQANRLKRDLRLGCQAYQEWYGAITTSIPENPRIPQEFGHKNMQALYLVCGYISNVGNTEQNL